MNDIWTTEDYTNKGKADIIADKYGLDASMVREALDDSEEFSDDMLVYESGRSYFVMQLDGIGDVQILIEDNLRVGLLESIDDIVCVFIDGVRYDVTLNIKERDRTKEWTKIANTANAIVIAAKYGLDTILVEEALVDGEVFSDNMLVYNENGVYIVIPIDRFVDLESLIEDLLYDTIGDVDEIKCIVFNGVNYYPKMNITLEEV